MNAYALNECKRRDVIAIGRSLARVLSSYRGFHSVRTSIVTRFLCRIASNGVFRRLRSVNFFPVSAGQPYATDFVVYDVQVFGIVYRSERVWLSDVFGHEKISVSSDSDTIINGTIIGINLLLRQRFKRPTVKRYSAHIFAFLSGRFRIDFENVYCTMMARTFRPFVTRMYDVNCTAMITVSQRFLNFSGPPLLVNPIREPPS